MNLGVFTRPYIPTYVHNETREIERFRKNNYRKLRKLRFFLSNDYRTHLWIVTKDGGFSVFVPEVGVIDQSIYAVAEFGDVARFREIGATAAIRQAGRNRMKEAMDYALTNGRNS